MDPSLPQLRRTYGALGRRMLRDLRLDIEKHWAIAVLGTLISLAAAWKAKDAAGWEAGFWVLAGTIGLAVGSVLIRTPARYLRHLDGKRKQAADALKTTTTERDDLRDRLAAREQELAKQNAHASRLYEEVNKRSGELARVRLEVDRLRLAIRKANDTTEAHYRLFLSRCEAVVKIGRLALDEADGFERRRREWPESVKDLLDYSVAPSIAESHKKHFLRQLSQAYPEPLDENWHAPTAPSAAAIREGMSLVTRLRDQVKPTDVEPWPDAPQAFYLDEDGFLTPRDWREMYE